MKKIVLIDHELFTIRRKKIFMIEEFINNGYDVEIWDISNIVYPNIKYPDEQQDKLVYKLYNIESLHKKLSSCNINNTIFIVECLDIWDNRKIYRLLSDFNCYIIKLDLYANTLLKESISNKLSRLFSKVFLSIFINQIKLIILKFYKRIYNIKSFDKIISSSSIVYRTDKINHPDYESYIQEKKEKPIISGDYIVFCDIFFPEHPDLLSCYKKRPDTQKYRKYLTDFFDYLEKKYNMPVIIAAHPKSDYKGDEFGQRKIIKYKTGNLVINSSMVLQHFSNSVSYCILANKPVIFFITEDMKILKQSVQYMELLCNTLGKKILNINKDEYGKIDASPIKEEYRKDYIYTYLTSKETECNSNFEILNHIFTEI